jgi:hypothetical protein
VLSVVGPNLQIVLAAVLDAAGSDDAVALDGENRFGALEQLTVVITNNI